MYMYMYNVHIVSVAAPTFPLRLRVALRGVAWRATVSAVKRVEALAVACHATQRAAVMEIGPYSGLTDYLFNTIDDSYDYDSLNHSYIVPCLIQL